MRFPRLGKVAPLDVITGLVLVLALGVAARPGAPLHAGVTNWVARRQASRLLEKHWAALAAAATPLFDGPGQPDVFEFSDYECPYCRDAHPAVDSAARAGVRIGLIHVPLKIHARARPAALAALCAAQSGRFRELNEHLMTTTQWQSDTASVIAPAHATPAWRAELAACLQKPETAALLERGLTLARTLSVTGTPTFLARTGVLREPPSVASLTRLAAAR